MAHGRAVRWVAAVIAFGMVSAVSAGDLYILSIGTEGMPTDPAVGDLYGRDAEFVRRALGSMSTWHETIHSRVLRGPQATRERVLAGLEWLATNARADDVTILFGSVHGSLDARNEFVIHTYGAWDAEGNPPPDAATNHVVTGGELNAALARLPGPAIVWLDTCSAGGLIDPWAASLTRCSYLTACRAEEESGGQDAHPDQPHGYFVLALCEALSGLADSDHDGIVRLQEVEAYVPGRSKAFRLGQNSVGTHQPALARLPLAVVEPGVTPRPLYTVPEVTGTNPFGVADVPDPRGGDVLAFALKAKFPPVNRDANREGWSDPAVTGPADTLAGRWAGRWRHGPEGEWQTGLAELKLDGNRVYLLFQEDYLLDLERQGDELVGRYLCLTDPDDTSPVVARIVGPDRIDGLWNGGRWDFRRTTVNDQ